MIHLLQRWACRTERVSQQGSIGQHLQAPEVCTQSWGQSSSSRQKLLNRNPLECGHGGTGRKAIGPPGSSKRQELKLCVETFLFSSAPSTWLQSLSFLGTLSLEQCRWSDQLGLHLNGPAQGCCILSANTQPQSSLAPSGLVGTQLSAAAHDSSRSWHLTVLLPFTCTVPTRAIKYLLKTTQKNLWQNIILNLYLIPLARTTSSHSFFLHTGNRLTHSFLIALWALPLQKILVKD